MTPLGPAYAAVIGARRLNYQPPTPANEDCPNCGNERRLFSHTTLTAVPCQCATVHEAASLHAALSIHSNLHDQANATFQALNPNGPESTDCSSYAEAFQEATRYAPSPDGVFTIAGHPLTGKTTLAAAIGNEALRAGQPALWSSSGDVIRALRRESASGADETAGRYRMHPFLLVDDIPATPATNWEKEHLLLLISERADSRRPTVYVLRGAPEQADPDVAAKICRQERGYSTHSLYRPSPPATPIRRLPPAAISGLMTFDAFLTTHGPDHLATAKATALMWAQDPSGWLCLTGATGTGKTHLALAATAVIAEQHTAVYYANTADLIAELRASVNSPYDPLQPAMTATLLVLDDYGAERNTAFADEQLTRLLAHRYDRRLPTIITTNLTPDELTASRPRIASRILDSTVTTLLAMTGPDYRKAS